MQLTLYVGSLTSFFATSLTEDAAAAGDPAPELSQVRQRVEAWRDWISAGLVQSGHLRRPLDWNEDDPHPPLRPALDLDALRALKLWLAYDAGADAPELLPDRPELDPRWRELAEQEFADTAWDQILVPELWLPGDAGFTFPCPYPDGHEVHAGWVGGLTAQLADLHERKLSATPLDALRAAHGADAGNRELRALAREAAGALQQVATQAQNRGLPMLFAPG